MQEKVALSFIPASRTPAWHTRFKFATPSADGRRLTSPVLTEVLHISPSVKCSVIRIVLSIAIIVTR